MKKAKGFRNLFSLIYLGKADFNKCNFVDFKGILGHILDMFGKQDSV